MSATALLREMAGQSASTPTPAPMAARHEPEPEPEAHPAAGLQRPAAPGGSADTAALLRELSSLGGDEPGHGSPAPGPRPSRPVPASHAARKRKGLWGRS